MTKFTVDLRETLVCDKSFDCQTLHKTSAFDLTGDVFSSLPKHQLQTIMSNS